MSLLRVCGVPLGTKQGVSWVRQHEQRVSLGCCWWLDVHVPLCLFL